MTSSRFVNQSKNNLVSKFNKTLNKTYNCHFKIFKMAVYDVIHA